MGAWNGEVYLGEGDVSEYSSHHKLPHFRSLSFTHTYTHVRNPSPAQGYLYTSGLTISLCGREGKIALYTGTSILKHTDTLSSTSHY